MNQTAVAIRSGNDVVNGETGEVVGAIQLYSAQDYLASVTSEAAFDHQKKLAAAYDKACLSLIGENDVQVEGNRTFKKKSAWRKLARHFNISTTVVGIQKEQINDVFVATVTVRAISPWGQTAEAVGSCGTDEATGRRTITIADAIATAETRATNRATSNLIAMGEVSAEEMTKSNNAPRSAAPRNSPNASGDPKMFRMPFGKTKGTPLGDMVPKDLQGAYDWAKEKGKFEDFQVAAATVLDVVDSATPENGEDYLDAIINDDADETPF